MTPMPSWLLRAALAAYPPAFRRHFGADLRDGLHAAWTPPGSARQPGIASSWSFAPSATALAERVAAVVRLIAAWRSDRPHLYEPAGPRAGMWDGWLHDLRAAAQGAAWPPVASRPWRSPRWRSASAPTARSSPSSTACC